MSPQTHDWEVIRKHIKDAENTLIQEFLDKLDKIRIYCDEWDYNIPQPLWDAIREYQERLKE